MFIQVSFEDFLGFSNLAPEVANKVSPTSVKAIAAGIVLSPKMLPSTIKKIPITHNEIPNTNETYSQRIIIPSFQTKSKPVKI
jgi:hypothetical protein